MVVIANNNSYNNWRRFSVIVGSLKFSHNYPRFSLDETLNKTIITSEMAKANTKVEASEIIDVIGSESFKFLVENIWNKDYYLSDIHGSYIWEYTESFAWDKTPQGEDYWYDIKIRLREHFQ